MFYSSTEYDSLMDWVFSFGGIITIGLIILLIWMIYNFFQKRKDDNNGNENNDHLPKYYPQSKKTIYDNQHNEEFEEKSFWDDINKTNSMQGSNVYPVREEEPIPPNAIPPSSYFEEVNTVEINKSEMIKEKEEN
jgi:hypothetical protein